MKEVVQLDLVVTSKCINEAQQLVSRRRVYKNVNLWECVAVLGACLI